MAVPAVPEEEAKALGRVARKRLRRVNEILQVAAEVLYERGYHNASLEEVADRLDLAKASLYHYFDSKEALIIACLGNMAEETTGRLRAVAEGEGSPSERLRRLLIEQQVIVTRDYPELSRLFLTHLEWPERIRGEIRGWHVVHDLIFKGVIDEGVRTGELLPIDPGVARHCLHGALNFVPHWYNPGGRLSEQEVMEAVADSVLRMFSASPPPLAG